MRFISLVRPALILKDCSSVVLSCCGSSSLVVICGVDVANVFVYVCG